MKFTSFLFLLVISSISVFAQTQVGSDIYGEAAEDQLGSSVALSADGKRLASGAVNNDGAGSSAGHVQVYEESGGTWSQVGNDIDGEAEFDRLGFAVSLSADGTIVAVSSIGNDGGGTDAGHVRIYEQNGNSWTQIGNDIDGEAAEDRFGYSLSLSSSGNRIAIGADRNDGGGTDAGHVRVYEYIGNTWTQIGNDIDGEVAGDRSGYSISLSSSGTKVAIGALNNDGSANESGHVRIFELIGVTWTQVGVDIDGEAGQDYSGTAVSLSADGTKVAIGAPYNDGTANSAGHVRVYEQIGSSWTQVGADIDGEAADDRSGQTVSLSSDGNRVAIGAPLNDDGGMDAGHVRLYQLVNGAWQQVDSDIDGESAGDESGASLALSADGMRVAIGADLSNESALAAGQVKVFGDILLPIGSILDVSDNIDLYPNPVHNLINLNTQEENIESIKLINAYGDLLIDIPKVEESIDVSNLPAGIYFLTGELEDKTFTKKFIKL